jgi:hypothetical protein
MNAPAQARGARKNTATIQAEHRNRKLRADRAMRGETHANRSDINDLSAGERLMQSAAGGCCKKQRAADRIRAAETY